MTSTAAAALATLRGFAERLHVDDEAVVVSKAAELVRLSDVKSGGSIGQLESMRVAVCFQLACMQLDVPIDVDELARLVGARADRFRAATNTVMALLGIRVNVTARELGVRFGCVRVTGMTSRVAQLFRDRWLELMGGNEAQLAPLERPEFVAAVFMLCARKLTATVNSGELCEFCRCTEAELRRMINGIHYLCFDVVGVAQVRPPHESIKEHRELVDAIVHRQAVQAQQQRPGASAEQVTASSSAAAAAASNATTTATPAAVAVAAAAVTPSSGGGSKLRGLLDSRNRATDSLGRTSWDRSGVEQTAAFRARGSRQVAGIASEDGYLVSVHGRRLAKAANASFDDTPLVIEVDNVLPPALQHEGRAHDLFAAEASASAPAPEPVAAPAREPAAAPTLVAKAEAAAAADSRKRRAVTFAHNADEPELEVDVAGDDVAHRAAGTARLPMAGDDGDDDDDDERCVARKVVRAAPTPQVARLLRSVADERDDDARFDEWKARMLAQARDERDAVREAHARAQQTRLDTFFAPPRGPAIEDASERE